MPSETPYFDLANLSRRGIDPQKLLQGWYEANRLPKDFSPERVVPDFAFNVLNPLGLLYRPVVDESYLAEGGRKPVWPEGKPFAVCLTHDVDVVSSLSFRQTARKRIENIKSRNTRLKKVRGLAGLGLDRVRALKNVGTEDPLHCYERWLQVEKEVGARSTFFLWPGWKAVKKHHHTDCAYDMQDPVVFDGQKCSVAEMIREIDRRGWEIGLHPSWYSFDDADEMKRQKESLESALGHEVVSVRQHYLHYDIRITPKVQAKAGFKYDSTLGFNDNVGFRFGTCHPWHLYDLGKETGLPIMEIPLIIQDGAMFNPSKGMRLDEETAFQYVEHIAKAVEKVGGVLTLLWHPNYIRNPVCWDLYRRTIRYLQQKNTWFCSVREAGEHWKMKQNQ